MRYAKITYPDVNNGTGCRVSIWLTGCSVKCAGCFNRYLWDEKYGIPISEKTKTILYEILSYPYIKGISILGGEPTDHDDELCELLKEIKEEFPDKDIWMWSGYTLHQLIEKGRTKCFPYIDVLVDGPFMLQYKQLNLKFRGSDNQHIYRRKDNLWILEE